MSEAESLYARAAKAELAKDLDTAFRLYIQAATAFLNASREAAHPRPQGQARKDAERALERAERIKAVKHDLAPVLRDPFAPEEQQLVLKKGSVVNGVVAPLWAAGTTGTSTAMAGTLAFCDPDGLLELSPEQKKAGVLWRRPREVFATDAKIFSPDLRPEDIVQRIVADCSLCASIIICLLHSRTHDSEAALPSLHPRGPDGRLHISPTGGYELKLLFNGAYRRWISSPFGQGPQRFMVLVVIDDRLPFRPDGCPMCMTSRGRKDIWPSLVEKAYLKLMGGYDFPGSNSSTDIHALAGWIPDYLEVKSPSFQREQTWSRLVRGFSDGNCILTLGTDNRPPADRGLVNLLPAHCYAVLDVKETDDGSRWLTVLDSWLPSDDADLGVDALLEDLSLCNESDDQRRRVINVAWDDACALFGSVCVSWNPGMFKCRLLYHGVWRAAHLSEAGRDDSVHQILRLLLERPKGVPGLSEEVWVLLTRHRTDTHRPSEFISLHAEYDDGHPDALKGFADTARTQGVYTDNTHVLVRVTVPPSDASGTISLNASYDGPFDDVGFTVTAYSRLTLRWDETPRRLPFDLRVSGALTAKTSGGNYTLPMYMVNPQYRLRVPPTTTQQGPSTKTRIEVALHAPRDVPVNATAIWGRGERVFDLVQSDIVATSGAYTYGFARFSADLPQGDFTLAVSAFSPTHRGDFSLLVCSSRRVEVEPIPQEGAGMFAKTVRGEWTNGAYPRYALELPTPAQVKIRLQPHAPLFVKVAILPGMGGAPLASSGAFTDARSGAATAQVALRAGNYFVEPTVDGVSRGDGTFSMVIYSSSAGIRLSPL
ncbi:hypothetical protein EDB87DRAFT_1678124 [Lactarius vividus]|nr:hypothetical protein EDB87DRAFT_1678124 [Lactarius vividus]